MPVEPVPRDIPLITSPRHHAVHGRVESPVQDAGQRCGRRYPLFRAGPGPVRTRNTAGEACRHLERGVDPGAILALAASARAKQEMADPS